MFQFLHIPLQAGSNRILDLMKREYHQEDFLDVVTKIKTKLPKLTLATDVICGFPTETEQEFEETLKIIEKTRPNVVNISRFWKRPNTPAAIMQQLPGGETKIRSTKLKLLFEEISLKENQAWIGWSGWIIIDEKESKKETAVGRNFAYKPVVVKGTHPLGTKLFVKISAATTYYLSGEIDNTKL